MALMVLLKGRAPTMGKYRCPIRGPPDGFKIDQIRGSKSAPPIRKDSGDLWDILRRVDDGMAEGAVAAAPHPAVCSRY